MRARSRMSVGLATILASAGLFAMDVEPVLAAGTTTVAPVADAFVSSAQPASNFGTAQQLSLSSGSDVRRAYLRFAVSGLTAPVSRATLRLWAQSASSDGFSVHKVADTTWGETTVTNQNAPTITNNQTDKSGGFAAGAYVELAVTALVSGNGTFSFGLKKAGNKAGTAVFDSREAAHPPQLVVEMADTTPPAVTLTTPPSGSTTADPTPTLAGDAGTATGDLPTVTVRIYSGSSVSGTPVQTAGTSQSGGRWTLDAAALASGTYTAQAQQSDASGNTGTSAPVTFTVDTVAPTVTLTSPASGVFVPTATPVLSGAAGTATGDGTQVTVKLYAGTGAGGAPVQTLPVTRQGASWTATAGALADGVYTARAEQADAAGNTGLSAAVTFRVDTSAPGLTVGAPLDGAAVGTADPLLSGTAGTAPGDVPSVSVELYAGPSVAGLPARVIPGVVPVASVWAAHPGPLADGTWTVRAVQDDAAGNHGVSTPITFTIDTVAPSPSIVSPASGDRVPSASPRLSGTAGAGAGDGETIAVDVYSGAGTAGTPVQTVSAPRSGDSWSVTAGTLADGTYTAQARQSDAAGNAGASTAVTFVIDTTAPSVGVITPPDGFLTTKPAPQLAGTAGDAQGDAAVVIVELFAGATPTGLPVQSHSALRSGTSWSVTPAALAAGTYTVRATQLDAAGNRGASAPRTFTIDGSAPGVTLAEPVAGGVTGDATPRLSGTAGDRDGDAATVTVRLWSGTDTAGTPLQVLSADRGGTAWNVNAAPLAGGTYTAQAEQSSGSGAVGRSLVVTFSVDTAVPAVTLDRPLPGAYVSEATPTLSGTAGSGPADGATVTVRLWTGTSTSGTPQQTRFAPRAGPAWTVDAAPLADGTYTAQASQATAGGATVTSGAVTFTVDTVAPAVGVDTPPAGATVATPTPQLAGAAGAAPGDTPTVDVALYAGTTTSGAPLQTFSATRSGGRWSVQAATLGDGTYTVRATQQDAAGNAASATATFSVAAAVPDVTLDQPPDDAVLRASTPEFSGTASTAVGDSSQVAVKVYAGTAVSGSPVQTLTATRSGAAWSVDAATLADGTYTARAQQDGAAGTGFSAANTFKIDTVAPTVTLTTPANGAQSADAGFDFAGAAGENGAVTVLLYEGPTASGIPVDTLTATAANGAWSVSGAVRNDGIYTARAQMRDAAGNVGYSSAHTFTLDTIAPDVRLTAPASLSILPSGPTFSGTAGTLPGDASTVSVKVYSGSTTSGTLVQTLPAAVAANGSWSVGATLAQGSYTGRAEQLDAAGNLGRSAPSTFKIGPTYQSEVAADAPQNWWRLGESSGTTAASSVASGGTAGSYLNGVTLRAPGAIGGDLDTAARFDGVNDSVSMGDPANGSLDLGTSDITIEAWLRTTVNGATTLVAKQGSTTGAYWNLLVYSAAPNLGKLRFTVTDGTTTRQVYSAIRVDDGVWHHVAVVFTRNTGLEMYVDNQRTSAAGALTTNIDNTAAFQIGKAFNYNYVNGDVDEVAIYRRALPAARIAAHFQAGFGPDVTAPAISLTSPAAAAVTDDPKPTLSGRVGTAPGDLPGVTVRVYAGTAATGSPAQTLSTAAAASGAWSTNANPALADGTYTVTASQDDASGNTGTSAPRTFQLQRAGPPQYRDAVLSDVPAGFWRLGERAGMAAGDETAADSAGSLENGVLLGEGGAVIGDADAAVRFDGIDDAIDAGDPAGGALDLGTSNATIEAWIRTTSGGVGSIVGKLPTSGPSWQLLVTNTPGRQGTVRAKFNDGTTTLQAYSSVTVNDGQWHHVTAVLDRSAGLTVDVDGISSSVAGSMSGTLSNDGPLGIGKLPGYPSFNGQIDEIAIYRTALSPQRVAAHAVEATRRDTTAPAPSLTAPADGGTVTDATPTFAGEAGADRGDVPRVTVKVYAGATATGTPVETAPLVVDPSLRWTLDPGAALPAGTYTAQAEQTDTAANVGRSAAVTFTVAPPAPAAGDPVLLAAGDIAGCDTFGDEDTAALLDTLAGAVQTLGDHAYEDGSAADFANCYDPTWGRFRARTHPSPGDHEYHTPNASGYFGYFGAAAGDPAKGYYSYDLGAWHIVVTNGNCEHVPGGCGPGSPQSEWLIRDLAEDPAGCTLAVIAAPRFSSGAVHGPDQGTQTFWNTLLAAGADVVLSADDHIYERFAPQTSDGRSAPSNGIRQFVIGTGGRSHYDLAGPQPNSEIRDNTAFGVLRLHLHADGYDWRFIPAGDATFTDVGSAGCH